MKQFIARVDDDLHQRLAQRARAEGRSINSLVVDALEAAVAGNDMGRVRIAAGDRLLVPPRPTRIPTWADVERAGKGAGNSVSAALDVDRQAR
jgi:plasmid stability protein